MADLESYIACELAPLVASVGEYEDTGGKHYYLHTRAIEGGSTILTDSPTLQTLYNANPVQLGHLIPHLVEYNFVASVLLVLDVTDMEGFTPSLGFITPYNMTGTFNRTIGIGGNLNTTQEHSETFVYTINLYQLYKTQPHNCVEHTAFSGIEGNLGLLSDVVSGLLSLDATSAFNINTTSNPFVSSATGQLKEDYALPLVSSKHAAWAAGSGP